MPMMMTVATLINLAHGANLLLSHHLATQLIMPRNFHQLFLVATISPKKKSLSRTKDLGDILEVDMEANTVANMKVNMVKIMMAIQDMVINHARDML